MKKLRASVLCVLLLAGCGTHGLIGVLPVFPAGAPAGEIVVMREWRSTASGLLMTVMLDGIPTYRIDTSEYVRIRVPPGNHVIGVRAGGTLDKPAIAVQVEAGHRYGFAIDIGTLLHPGPLLKPLSVTETEALMSRLTPISP
jgi:hypothetical protein